MVRYSQRLLELVLLYCTLDRIDACAPTGESGIGGTSFNIIFVESSRFSVSKIVLTKNYYFFRLNIAKGFIEIRIIAKI